MMTTDVATIVRHLANRFQKAQPGEVVTYDDLSEAIGQDVKMVRTSIYKAMELAATESGALFKTLYKKGYQRLLSTEIDKIGQTTRRQIRRKARLGARRMDAAMRGVNDMEPDVLRRVLREQSALGLIEHVSRDKSLPVIPDDAIQPMTPGQSARAFLEEIGGLRKSER